MAHHSDTTWPIAVSLAEALRGCSRVIYFPRREMPCRACKGSGERDGRECDQCDGTGWADIIKRVPVDLPPLPGDLARVRVGGGGAYDGESGGFGDLRIVCHIVPQGDLELADGQLHVTLPVTPDRQALGGRFELALPEESVAIDLQGPLADGDLYEFDIGSAPSGEQRALVVEISITHAPDETRAEHPDPDEVSRLHAEGLNAEKSRDFVRALEAYRRLAEVAPSSRISRKSGWMYFRLDDLDAAADCMQRAVDQDWSSAEAHYYKGAVHHKRREPLLAAVEMEYAARLGLDVKQAESIRRGALLDVFAVPAGLPGEAHEQFSGLISEAINRYYGVATAACRDLLREHPEAGVYYQFGAAAWLESISGEEERIAEAYLGLRAASTMAPEAGEYAGAYLALQRILDRTASSAPHLRIAAYLLREGEAAAALDQVGIARSRTLGVGPGTDRDAAGLDEATEAALAACTRLSGTLQPIHGAWEQALGSTIGACSRLEGMLGGMTAGPEPVLHRQVSDVSRAAMALGRDEMLPLCAELQGQIEQDRRALPRRCHAWLETIIRETAKLTQSLRRMALLSTRRSDGAGDAASDGIEALEQMRGALAALRESLQEQYAYLDQSLCDAWRAWSHLLHIRVVVSQQVGRDDHLDRCRHLARAVALEQLAANMRPEAERDVEERGATCRLLDDFQGVAQAAAGTEAFARAEFFQNTIDSLRGDIVPGKPLAESLEDLLQESNIELFDWSCEVLFDGTTAFPQEFLIDARKGSYAVTNYRLAHRQTDATTFLPIPLTSIQRYDVRASGATTRAVTLTLRDGRRVTFNDVPAEHVLDRERMSWLLAAQMWKTLTQAELEALEANRPAPTPQLSAEGAHDRQRLLGDTRQPALAEGAQTVVCRHCGRHNFRRDRFCRDCGAQLQEPMRDALPAEDTPALPDAKRSREDGGRDALP